MKRCLNVIGIFLLLQFFPYCANQEAQKNEGRGSSAHAALAEIDSLMWWRADSAFVLLQEFVVSPEAKELDTFDGHYCQLLISELLYKNDCEQTNRTELLQALSYFDSLTFTLNDTPHASRRHCGLDPQSPEHNDNLTFLTARAHYINGVGYYEKDSIVQACAEYLKALEVMEAHFEEKELVGEKARFMTLTHGRLGDMFSEQFMMDPSIMCYKNALVYCNIEPTSPTGISNLLTRLGVQYDKLGDKEKMRDCYGQALEAMPSCDNLSYRDLAASKAFCDYQLGLGIDHSLAALRRILVDADNEEERKTRFLAIGAMFAEERMYDSAMYYLEPLFENEDDIALKIPAAECLRNIYDSIGDNEKLDKCLHFMALRKKSEAQSKALVSQLDELMKSYTNQKLKNEAEKTREKAVRKAMNIVIPIAIWLVLVIIVLAKLRNKKSLKKQQEEADKVLGEAEQEHEKKLRLRQAMADKTLEETKKKYEGELRQLREETEQQLEEEERKHQQWMAKAREHHEEELKVQKDLSEKEMGEIRKRHDGELEAERVAHRQEMETKEQAAQHEREQYEEELRQRDAEAKQHLEEAEQRHREKTAEMAQRHEEEMRSQQDKTEDEISATQKRYEQELEAVRQAHQQEMEAKAAEAKADRELHEEELRRRREQAEQWLAEAEQDHRRKVAELAKRQEEETRRQQEKMEQEREQAKKRHEAELEAERMAYRKEQEALRQSLRQREVQVNALEMAMGRQREEAERRREAFLKEPICQRILGQVRRKTITTRENAFELGLSLKDEDFEQLGTAVEKHYEGFDNMLLSQCPSLKQGLISLCHLHLLGINEREIAVLKNVSYSAIKKQNESLQEKLGVEENVAEYVLRVAEGLCVPQGVLQDVSQKILQGILDIVSINPKITREEMANQLGVSSKTVGRYLKKLGNRVRYVGSGYSGHWEVIR